VEELDVCCGGGVLGELDAVEGRGVDGEAEEVAVGGVTGYAVVIVLAVLDGAGLDSAGHGMLEGLWGRRRRGGGWCVGG